MGEPSMHAAFIARPIIAPICIPIKDLIGWFSRYLLNFREGSEIFLSSLEVRGSIDVNSANVLRISMIIKVTFWGNVQGREGAEPKGIGHINILNVETCGGMAWHGMASEKGTFFDPPAQGYDKKKIK